MKVRYVPRFDVDAVLQPDAALWQQAEKPETVKLKGTPLDMQPTGAIKVSWADKKIGAVEVVQVAAIHDGERIAFRLEWTRTSPTAAGSSFPPFSSRPWPSWAPLGWR
jgi:hypothetical protein